MSNCLQPGRLCPVGGETRCAEVMALNKEWKLRFENVQPEWLNEFLSSSLTVGLKVFPHFFGHRGYNRSQTFIEIIKCYIEVAWLVPVSSMWHTRLAGLKLALSLAGGSQTFDSNEEIVQLRLGEPQAGFAESHPKE